MKDRLIEATVWVGGLASLALIVLGPLGLFPHP